MKFMRPNKGEYHRLSLEPAMEKTTKKLS